jgi:hypothetical protein
MIITPSPSLPPSSLLAIAIAIPEDRDHGRSGRSLRTSCNASPSPVRRHTECALSARTRQGRERKTDGDCDGTKRQMPIEREKEMERKVKGRKEGSGRDASRVSWPSPTPLPPARSRARSARIGTTGTTCLGGERQRLHLPLHGRNKDGGL